MVGPSTVEHGCTPMGIRSEQRAGKSGLDDRRTCHPSGPARGRNDKSGRVGQDDPGRTPDSPPHATLTRSERIPDELPTDPRNPRPTHQHDHRRSAGPHRSEQSRTALLPQPLRKQRASQRTCHAHQNPHHHTPARSKCRPRPSSGSPTQAPGPTFEVGRISSAVLIRIASVKTEDDHPGGVARAQMRNPHYDFAHRRALHTSRSFDSTNSEQRGS